MTHLRATESHSLLKLRMLPKLRLYLKTRTVPESFSLAAYLQASELFVFQQVERIFQTKPKME